ncbi:MAG TPA: adenine phosphoribosyltransferase [Chloroflexota bacterium]|nr:adenine phosphoribosyltransferase [Chloroflexota bacterium]
MQQNRASDVAARIREIPDFPIPGVMFKDITPVLQDPALFQAAIDLVAELFPPDTFDVIVGLESRGFVFGAPVAYKLGYGFIPIRKLGKLPSGKVSVEYQLEYGSHTLEMHADGILPGQRALIVDDLLATGGTCGAAVNLVERLGGIVTGAAFLVELSFLRGREKLAGYDVRSVVRY